MVQEEIQSPPLLLERMRLPRFMHQSIAVFFISTLDGMFLRVHTSATILSNLPFLTFFTVIFFFSKLWSYLVDKNSGIKVQKFSFIRCSRFRSHSFWSIVVSSIVLCFISCIINSIKIVFYFSRFGCVKCRKNVRPNISYLFYIVINKVIKNVIQIVCFERYVFTCSLRRNFL